MDFEPLIERKRRRFEELESEISSPGLFDNAAHAREVLREHGSTKELLESWEKLTRARRELVENRELAAGEDKEMAAMAREEIERIEPEIPLFERAVQVALLPPEPDEDRDAIVEIRAGTGGTEAALFAADLHRMYCRYADTLGLKVEELESSPADLGGLREVIFRISGTSVFRRFRYESGVHRVQRVPATAVLPEAEEVDIEIKPEDLRIEVCRAGGPGGQGVNTTDSAVQVMHIPTGRIVRCQDGRSQQKNKEAAIKIMRSRLLEDKRREEEEKYSAHRRSLIGGGGREEKIRTYNFAENRVTDHRIKLSLYSLDRFLEGDIGGLVEALQISDIEQRLKDSGIA
ncbi:MAG: PCRF domain-containing protein [Proteobacteria bacterium]|nr:PCRF domain-containing protein [Pseudomonadota bacterium]